jgi:glutathione peroxidase
MLNYLPILLMLLVGSPNSIYEFKSTDINGHSIDLSKFKGKKILIVNVASECGYTPQYEGLQKLHEKYKDKLVIIGFPANNFGQQEPGTNDEIKSFCAKNYAVTFQMMSKVSVKGDDIDPLFKWMIDLPNPDFTGDIKWNFEKFLFDEHGNLIHRYRSKTEPMSEVLQSAIEANN